MKKLISNLTNPERVYDTRVGDLVSSVYPSVPSNANLSEVADLLSRGHSAVLVVDGVDLKGIITKIDVITALRIQHGAKE